MLNRKASKSTKAICCSEKGCPSGRTWPTSLGCAPNGEPILHFLKSGRGSLRVARAGAG